VAADAISIKINCAVTSASAIRRLAPQFLTGTDYLIIIEPEYRIKEGGIKWGSTRKLLQEAKKRGIDYTIVPIP